MFVSFTAHEKNNNNNKNQEKIADSLKCCYIYGLWHSHKNSFVIKLFLI